MPSMKRHCFFVFFFFLSIQAYKHITNITGIIFILSLLRTIPCAIKEGIDLRSQLTATGMGHLIQTVQLEHITQQSQQKNNNNNWCSFKIIDAATGKERFLGIRTCKNITLQHFLTSLQERRDLKTEQPSGEWRGNQRETDSII